MTGKSIRVLIADDHEIVRKGVRLLLDAEPGIEVVGEASDGAEAVRVTAELNPDVVVMDISMPEMNGIEATSAIRVSSPDVNVVGLTMHSDERYFFEMLKAGAAGYVVKGGAPHELVDAIEAAARGDAYVHPSLALKLIKGYMELADRPGPAGHSDSLTAREREVLQLIAEGLTAREIGERLVISVNTVDRHRSNIMGKLDLHNKAELVRYAVRKGLVSAD